LFPSRHERYLFRQSDAKAAWRFTFDGNQVRVDRDATEADVTVEAPGSDILLFLWNRLPPQRLSTAGNRRLLARYHDLVPSW